VRLPWGLTEVAPSKIVARTLVRFLKLTVRRGFVPACPPPTTLRWAERGSVAGLIGSRDTIFLIPTYLDRCSSAEQAEAVRRIVAQMAGPGSTDLASRAAFILLLQHDPAQTGAAEERARDILASVNGAEADWLSVALIDVHGKVNALNTCLRALDAAGYDGLVGWVDDDVQLGVDCLAELARTLRQRGEVMIAGAAKIPVPNVQRAASIFLRIKTVARATSRPIPHGCCILGRFDSLKSGIPARYVGEDGYLSMRHYDETRADPLEAMAVVPTATCVHTVGGPLGQIWKRVRRTIYTNSILLADFPEDRSVHFAREIIFHGLLSSRDGPSGRIRVTTRNKLLKLILLLGYFEAGATILLRSLLRRPLQQVAWSGYSDYSHPFDAANVNGVPER
jgi:hypothetical protein